MHELGNVQYAAQGARALKPPRNELPDPIKEKATIKFVDDDTAVALVGKLWHPQEIQQDSPNADALLSTNRPTNTNSQSNVIPLTSESASLSVYSNPSEFVAWLKDEIKAINSFDGFLLGVHEKIEEFTEQTEFGLEQILDVEQNITELHETLELYKFSLQRITADAIKALRGQGNLEPQRVLHLLRESVSMPKTVEQAIEEQANTVSEQNE